MGRKRKIKFELPVSIPADRIAHLEATHRNIINEVIDILNSQEIVSLSIAYMKKESLEVTCCGRQILFENNIPCVGKHFGMSLFQDDGFLIACKSFQNKKELIKTLLHEVYRLHTSELRDSGPLGAVGDETQAAMKFSSYIYKKIFKS